MERRARREGERDKGEAVNENVGKWEKRRKGIWWYVDPPVSDGFLLPSSVSSNYLDLMPQFLRSVRLLCALHKYYLDAVRAESSSSPVISSVPVSPLSTSVPNNSLQQPVSTVRRAGSFGSLLDSPRNRGGSGRLKLRTFRGHKRSNSQGVPPRFGSSRDSDTSPSSPSRSHSDSISSPFEELEVVWVSLESWFDLLIIEVQKLEDQNNDVVTEPRKQTLELELGSEEVAMNLVSNSTENVVPSHTPTNADDIPDVSVSSACVYGEHSDSKSNSPVEKAPDSSPHRKPPKVQLPLVQSSQLAAAIVNSAPQERRAIYLKSSSSFDVAEPALPLVHLSDMAHKRRSWHVERVAARILTLGGGGSLTSLSVFSRSLSSDSTVTERQSMFCDANLRCISFSHMYTLPIFHFFLPTDFPGVIPTSPLLEDQESGERDRQGGDALNCSESWNPDIVGTYADRLCAVTHAFALCCSTLHKSSGG